MAHQRQMMKVFYGKIMDEWEINPWLYTPKKDFGKINPTKRVVVSFWMQGEIAII